MDYGISRSLKKGNRITHASTFCGSSGYMAPEVFSQNYAFSSDVFGFGVLCYLLIYKTHPFPMSSSWEYEECMMKREPLVLPSPIPAIMEKLLLRMLSYNPNDRPEFQEICSTLKYCLDRISADSFESKL